MSSAFDFIERADYIDGNPVHLSCHNGMVFVLEETASRPATVRLRNVDNLDGEDPDPATIDYEDLPQNLRRELKQRGMRFSSPMTGATLAEAM